MVAFATIAITNFEPCSSVLMLVNVIHAIIIILLISFLDLPSSVINLPIYIFNNDVTCSICIWEYLLIFKSRKIYIFKCGNRSAHQKNSKYQPKLQCTITVATESIDYDCHQVSPPGCRCRLHKPTQSDLLECVVKATPHTVGPF